MAHFYCGGRIFSLLVFIIVIIISQVFSTPAGKTRCLNGAEPQGTCANYGPCPTGTNCTLGFVCCPTFTNQVPGPGNLTIGIGQLCSNGQPAVAQCINGACGYGYICLNDRCCGSGSTVTVAPFPYTNYTYGNCPQGYVAVGICINGMCPAGGFNQGSCVNNTCCQYSPYTQTARTCPPGVPTLATCVNGRCPAGYTCTAGNICCSSSFVTPYTQNLFCPGGLTSAGPCVNGQCRQGFVCTGNICCPGTSPTIGQSTCPFNQRQLGPCIGNLCPTGYTCYNGQCCGA